MHMYAYIYIYTEIIYIYIYTRWLVRGWLTADAVAWSELLNRDLQRPALWSRQLGPPTKIHDPDGALWASLWLSDEYPELWRGNKKTAWWLTLPLWKIYEFVSWGYKLPNIWKVIKVYKSHVPNHQADLEDSMVESMVFSSEYHGCPLDFPV